MTDCKTLSFAAAAEDSSAAKPEELLYAPSTTARPVWIEEEPDVIRVVVAMPGVYVPVPHVLRALIGGYGGIVYAVYWLVVWTIRTIRKTPAPPRAVFEVTRGYFTMITRDPHSGDISTVTWPRSAVVEARANRYDKGVWVHVAGEVKDTFLVDLKRPTVERIEAALVQAFAWHDEKWPGEGPAK
ncbi:MAG: hypothetical protein QM754_02335 [Tepidisphaeraceae bacterium]